MGGGLWPFLVGGAIFWLIPLTGKKNRVEFEHVLGARFELETI